MQQQVNDQVTIHYELEGPAGAPLVTCSHSLAADLELWDPQLPELLDAYRVLRFDTRGHGTSSAPPGAYTMEMLTADLVGLLDRLEIEKTHFVGISMGGMIGQVFGIHHPERVQSLVLCNTTSRSAPEMGPAWEERIQTAQTHGMSALAEGTLERWLSEDFRRNCPQTTERIRNMILSTPVAGYEGCCRAISNFDVTAELNRIDTPTLIIVGEQDISTTVSHAQAIHNQVRDSELLVLPKALHLTNVETVTAFNQALRNFLDRHSGT